MAKINFLAIFLFEANVLGILKLPYSCYSFQSLVAVFALQKPQPKDFHYYQD